MERKRIAIISDVHAYYDKLRIALEQIEKANVTDYIYLGDIINGDDQPKKALERMKSLKLLSWVRGNTDDWIVIEELEKEAREVGKGDIIDRIQRELSREDMEFVRCLPISELIEVCGYKIMCCHGSPDSNTEKIEEYLERKEDQKLEYDLLICGHTHMPASYEHQGTIVINVGSIGKANISNKIDYGILEIGEYGFTFEHVSINDYVN